MWMMIYLSLQLGEIPFIAPQLHFFKSSQTCKTRFIRRVVLNQSLDHWFNTMLQPLQLSRRVGSICNHKTRARLHGPVPTPTRLCKCFHGSSVGVPPKQFDGIFTPVTFDQAASMSFCILTWADRPETKREKNRPWGHNLGLTLLLWHQSKASDGETNLTEGFLQGFIAGKRLLYRLQIL